MQKSDKADKNSIDVFAFVRHGCCEYLRQRDELMILCQISNFIFSRILKILDHILLCNENIEKTFLVQGNINEKRKRGRSLQRWLDDARKLY